MITGYVPCDNCGGGSIPVDAEKLHDESKILCADCGGYECDREYDD